MLVGDAACLETAGGLHVEHREAGDLLVGQALLAIEALKLGSGPLVRLAAAHVAREQAARGQHEPRRYGEPRDRPPAQFPIAHGDILSTGAREPARLGFWAGPACSFWNDWGL